MTVFLEVTASSITKFRFNEETFEPLGSVEVLLPYPYAYGFIPGTLTDDGEAVDAFIITSNPLEAGTSVDCEPAGLLEMFEDDETDHKIIACLPGESFLPLKQKRI